jgi:SAM-dependent methyltransferase
VTPRKEIVNQQALKARLRRHKWAIAALMARTELQADRARRRGESAVEGADTHRDRPLDWSLDYIDEVVDDYLRYGQLKPPNVAGLSVLEVGPGDNLGVALRLQALGAVRVATLDRFWSAPDKGREEQIYRALARRHGTSFDPAAIETVFGIAVEDALQAFGPVSFDLIVSRAVLEHVRDVPAALRAMDALLMPGGRMLHKVDLRDHGMFTEAGLHPLTFLTFPGALYRWMSQERGCPNRVRVTTYRDVLATLGYSCEFRPTVVVGRDDELVPHPRMLQHGRDYGEREVRLVEGIRRRMARPFRNLPTEDLVTTGIFLVATKPAAQ